MIEQNWQSLIKPKVKSVLPIDGSDVTKKAKIEISPLERGFGYTLGNSLRRVLLSSLQGACITSVKMSNALHEFSSVPGVLEDVVDIILNIKEIKVKSNTTKKSTLHLKVVGPAVVTAADIQEDHSVEIINKDALICTVDAGHTVEMSLNVEVGKGYVPVEHREKEEKEIGLILIDAVYSPIESVKYEVENARVGQMTDYDKLVLEITTNGSVTPEDSIALSAKILQEQFNEFINFEKTEIKHVEEEKEETIPFPVEMLKKIEELEFSVRSANCLKNDNIIYVGDLVQKTEAEMLKTPNFGRKSLNEIREILSKMNLHLGMKIDNWPPENIEELIKKHEDKF